MAEELQDMGQRAEFAVPLAELVIALSDLERRLALGLATALSEENATFDQWRIMETLARLDSPTMGELAEASGMPNASLSRAVDSLEDSASAFRLPGVSDRRRITVHLSDRGLERLARVREIVGSWEQATEQSLGTDVSSTLLDVARKATHALHEGVPRIS